MSDIAEIERLREALQKIARNQYGLQALQEDGADDAAISQYFSEMAFRFQGIARAALTAEKSNWHPQTAHYAAECCDMTDRERVIGLLDAYAKQHKEGQLAVLLHSAARMLEQAK